MLLRKPTNYQDESSSWVVQCL